MNNEYVHTNKLNNKEIVNMIDYKLIFANVTTRNKAEEICQTKLNKNYIELLTEWYIDKEYTKYEISELTGFKLASVTNHLTHYGLKRPRHKETEGVYTRTPTQIEKEYGKKFTDIVREKMEQGLSVTEIAKELKLRSASIIAGKMAEEEQRKRIKDADPSNYILPDLGGKRPKTIEKMFREQLGIEYKDFLYDKYIVEGMSIVDIVLITGISKDALNDRLNHYGIKKTRSQVRNDDIKKGKYNYTEITSKARKTMRKSNSKSSRQDILRELIRHYLELEIPSDIEFVVGNNEWGILKNKEVDIPIMAINKDKFIKFSIEVNGEIWHEDEQDTIKKNRLKDKGWIHFIFHINKTQSKSNSYVEDYAKEVVEQIKEHTKELL